MFRDVGMNFIICMKDKYQPAVTSLKNCITISLTEKRNLQSDWLILTSWNLTLNVSAISALGVIYFRCKQFDVCCIFIHFHSCTNVYTGSSKTQTYLYKAKEKLHSYRRESFRLNPPLPFPTYHCQDKGERKYLSSGVNFCFIGLSLLL